jgi:hypothetical protein
MSMTSGGSIGAAFPGANNVVGQVSAVQNRGASEGFGGTVATSTEDYPHEKNGAKGSFTGPVNQKAVQRLGTDINHNHGDEYVPMANHPLNSQFVETGAYPALVPTEG